MQVVIPMSGRGSRFQRAGYKNIKPLIKVDGKPIIEWVVNMFSKSDDFIFICSNDHLEETDLRSVLNKIAPNGKIIGIEPHKFGPTYAVSKAFEAISDNDKTIVNYCDFYMLWNVEDFKKTVSRVDVDGAIPCYTGFHPHLTYKNNYYAGCRVDEDLKLIEIKEKFSFTEDKTKSHHSVGTYYFKSGESMKHYFQNAIERDLKLNGEYYVSLVYDLLLEDKKNVLVYDKISHFCQWGTPNDLKDYEFYVNSIKGWK